MKNIMGIGVIGGNFSLPKRKIRWTFTGKDDADNCTMSEQFVRISTRPAIHSMPEMSVPSNPIPDEMQIIYYDLGNETFPDADKTTTGILKLYGSVGDLLESWTLEGVKVKHLSFDEVYEDQFESMWRVSYKVAHFKSHTPLFES